MFKTVRKKYLNLRYPPYSLFGNVIVPAEEANDFIYRRITEGKKPFLIARLGAQECSGFWQQVFWERFPFLGYPKEDKRLLSINTGMFSTGPLGRHFYVKMFKKALRVTDAVCFTRAKEEGLILHKYANKGIPYLSLDVTALGFFRLFQQPWTNALEGKRVLVVSPFAGLIERQYLQKDRIHNGDFKLPQFTLITFKAPLTQNGEDKRFRNWKQALNYIYTNTKDIKFDIALLGCGSYGLPLQGMYKRIGKSSIYLGAEISPLFGIFGERWKDMPFLNEYWVRPSKEDTPKCAPLIEGGCYW